jgi:chromate transporter
MDAADFSRFVALSQATPGPISVNAATYVGFYTAGVPGALAATLGVALPSFVYVLLAMRFIERFERNRGLQAAFAGVRPVTVGLVASAAVFMAEGTLIRGAFISAEWLARGLSYVNPVPCAIFACALLLAGKFRVNALLVLLLAAGAGAVFIR